MTNVANEAPEITGATRVVGAGLLALTFAYIVGMASPFLAGKEAVIGLVTAFTLLVVAADREHLWPQWPVWWLVIPLCAALVAIVSARLNASDPLASAVMRVFVFAGFLLGLRYACADAVAADWLARVIVVAAASEAVLVLAQVILAPLWLDSSGLPSDKWKAFGTLGNPNWTGSYLAVGLPLASWRTMRSAKLLWALAVVAISAALVVTLSRGAWLAAVVGVVIVVRLGESVRRRRGLFLASLGVVIGVGIAWASFGSRGALTEIGRRGSIDGRLRMWQVSARMIADRPALGWGVGRFAAVYPGYQRAFLQAHDCGPVTDVTDHPHNEYLYMATETGAAGVAVALIGFAFLVRAGARSRARRRLIPWVAGLIAIAVHGAFDIPLHLPVTAALFCVLLAGFVATAMEPRQRRALSAGRRVFLAVAAILALGYAVRLVVVDLAVRSAWSALSRADLDEAIRQAERGIRFEPASAELLTAVARAQARSGRTAEGLSAARRAAAIRPGVELSYLIAGLAADNGELDSAEDELRTLSETMPGLLEPRLRLAALYERRGEVERARDELRRCLTIRPKLVNAASRRALDRARRQLAALEAVEEED